jgi:hypothetical protein
VTKKIIEDLRKILPKSSKILVGGSAFSENKDNVKALGADFYAQTFEDIKNVAENGVGV